MKRYIIIIKHGNKNATGYTATPDYLLHTANAEMQGSICGPSDVQKKQDEENEEKKEGKKVKYTTREGTQEREM
jgi:hypothetical protein